MTELYKGFKIRREIGGFIAETVKGPYRSFLSPRLDGIYDLIDGKRKIN
mgnify:CR=1 FL=1